MTLVAACAAIEYADTQQALCDLAQALGIDAEERWDHDDCPNNSEIARELIAVAKAVTAERDSQKAQKDAAYLERNKLVALLASLFPSGIAKTAIEGWSEDWHGCVYIDFPGFQASWHYHDSQAYLFEHLPPYEGSWDGHTTEEKYEKIVELAREATR